MGRWPRSPGPVPGLFLHAPRAICFAMVRSMPARPAGRYLCSDAHKCRVTPPCACCLPGAHLLARSVCVCVWPNRGGRPGSAAGGTRGQVAERVGDVEGDVGDDGRRVWPMSERRRRRAGGARRRRVVAAASARAAAAACVAARLAGRRAPAATATSGGGGERDGSEWVGAREMCVCVCEREIQGGGGGGGANCAVYS